MYLIKRKRFYIAVGVGKNIIFGGKGICKIKYSIRNRLRLRTKGINLFNYIISGCFYKWYWFFQICIQGPHNRKAYTIEEFKQLLNKK